MSESTFSYIAAHSVLTALVCTLVSNHGEYIEWNGRP